MADGLEPQTVEAHEPAFVAPRVDVMSPWSVLRAQGKGAAPCWLRQARSNVPRRGDLARRNTKKSPSVVPPCPPGRASILGRIRLRPLWRGFRRTGCTWAVRTSSLALRSMIDDLVGFAAIPARGRSTSDNNRFSCP